MNKNVLKVFGLIASVVGFGATMLTAWVNEKNMDNMVEEKVNKALAKRAENNEEENEETES